jgi:hypothetical protein
VKRSKIKKGDYVTFDVVNLPLQKVINLFGYDLSNAVEFLEDAKQGIEITKLTKKNVYFGSHYVVPRSYLTNIVKLGVKPSIDLEISVLTLEFDKSGELSCGDRVTASTLKRLKKFLNTHI